MGSWRDWYAEHTGAGSLAVDGYSTVIAEGYSGSLEGLTTIIPNNSSPSDGMVAYKSTDYATPMMFGDCKLTAFCENSTDDLVAHDSIVNGNYLTDITSWASLDPTNLVLSHVTDAMRVQYGLTDANYNNFLGDLVGNYPSAGEQAVLVIKLKSVTAFPSSGLRFYVEGSALVNVANTTDEQVFPVSAKGGNKVTFRARGTLDVEIEYIKYVNVIPDRSVNNNGLVIHGTVPVDDDGWLGRFYGTDYLSQPYNPGLDFGTGAFYIAASFKPANDGAAYPTLVQRSIKSGPENQARAFSIKLDRPQKKVYVYADSTLMVYSSDRYVEDVENFVLAYRDESNIWHIFLNGVETLATSPDTTDYTLAGAELSIGTVFSSGVVTNTYGGKLKNLVIGAGAPSPEQIKFMARYKPDPVPGASSAILDLSFNKTTKLLRVLTSDKVFSVTETGAVIDVIDNTDGWTKLTAVGPYEVRV